MYNCIECKTEKYLIFPNRDESLIICSSCYRILLEKKEKEEQDKKQKEEQDKKHPYNGKRFVF